MNRNHFKLNGIRPLVILGLMLTTAMAGTHRIADLLERSALCPLPIAKIQEQGKIVHLGLRTGSTSTEIEKPLLWMGQEMLLAYCSARDEWPLLMRQDRAVLRINGQIPQRLDLAAFAHAPKFQSGFRGDSLTLLWTAGGQRLELSVFPRRELFFGWDRPQQDSVLRQELTQNAPTHALLERLLQISKRSSVQWPGFVAGIPRDSLGLQKWDEQLSKLSIPSIPVLHKGYQRTDTLRLIDSLALSNYLRFKNPSLAHEIVGSDSVRIIALFQDKVFSDMDLWEWLVTKDSQGQWQSGSIVLRSHIPLENLDQIFFEQKSKAPRFKMPEIP